MILVSMLFLSCDNDDYPHAEIPSVVLNEFHAHYPNATDIEFIKVGRDYEVDFEIDGIDAGALISSEGILIKEKKEISVEKFPLGVQKALDKLGKNKIGNPEIVKTRKDSFYQVQVKRFGLDRRVVLDRTGKELEEKYWD